MTLRSSFALALALALVFTVPAAAHDPAPWITARWKRSLTVPWRLHSTITVQAVRDRIIDGSAPWNNQGQPMSFRRLADSSRAFAMCGSAYQDNVVYRRDIADPDVLGSVYTCTFSGTNELYSFTMQIDVGRDFYLGTGTPGSSQWDLYSTAAHEFGHAAGFLTHMSEGGVYCGMNGDGSSPTRHTMCPNIPAGTRMMRTLGPHDADIFANAY